MGQYRFQAVFKTNLSLPEDYVTNTWYANCADDTAAMFFAGELRDFYITTHAPATGTIAAYMGVNILRTPTTHEIKVYDLADPTPRVPVGIVNFIIPAPSNPDNMPREVAVCLSFQAAQVSGANQARRRGRVYLGPFNTAIIDTAGGNDARPKTDFIRRVQEGAQALLASTEGEWAVHSTFSGVLLPVDNGWVDDSFDTVRRRGTRPTARNIWNATTP